MEIKRISAKRAVKLTREVICAYPTDAHWRFGTSRGCKGIENGGQPDFRRAVAKTYPK